MVKQKCPIFECFTDAEYMRDFVPSCSCSQGGPVCRDWIFHGVIACSVKIFYRLQPEGKERSVNQFICLKPQFHYWLQVVSLSFRVNFTTSGSTRSLRSPLQPSPCRPRSTTCCTSACLPSPPTLQPLSTTQLEPSACTSLTTWWAASSWFPHESTFMTSHWSTTFLVLSQQIPQGSPIRLNTKTFGVFVPQVTTTDYMKYGSNLCVDTHRFLKSWCEAQWVFPGDPKISKVVEHWWSWDGRQLGHQSVTQRGPAFN